MSFNPVGSVFDPIRADFPAQTSPYTDITIAGLTALAAFGVIGVGAFFSAAAVESGTATGSVYIVNGVEYVAESQEIAEAWAAVDEAIANGTAIPQGASDVLTTSLTASESPFLAGGMNSVAALAALASYQPPNPNQYKHFGHYMGPYANGGGPGNPGGGNTDPWFVDPSHPGAIGKICYTWPDGELLCYWIY